MDGNHREPLARAASLMRQQSSQDVRDKENSGLGSALGRGFISGAADDDPSAIGTYASAGARFGLDILWTAPVTLPMMFTIVYLSSKLGQVSGRGLFQAIHDFYPRWLLWLVLTGVVLGNKQNLE
jgi:Mn2+/Fe2+ NRAMP family transporter